MSIHHPDHDRYRHFSRKQRTDKAIHTLLGILKGITIDNQLNSAEIAELLNWCTDHGDLKHRAPFDELIPTFERIMADGVIDPEEQEDLLWLCQNLSADSEYFSEVTNDIQALQGILHGILADGIITLEEATRLQEWLEDHENLKGTYPYDELDSILLQVLADKKIDEDEQDLLKSFFEEFVDFSLAKKMSQARSSTAKRLTLPGVCSSCPTIEFEGKTFVITGSSYKGTKAELAKKIQSLNGRADQNLTQKTDFLVVGAAGNPCWAFSCYGRKVEKAVGLRKQGHPILIVHESDLWDAIEDFGG